MKWISFGWTAAALEQGQKTVTRRDWKASHAAKFHKGDIVQALDKRPDRGGKKIALVQLTRDPYLEWSNEIPASDWFEEGFAFLSAIGETVDGEHPTIYWLNWLTNPKELWVIRFKVVGF